MLETKKYAIVQNGVAMIGQIGLTLDKNEISSILGGIYGFTWKPANYDGYINNLGAGFVYYRTKTDDPSLPTPITPGAWVWVMTFGRGDGLQIATSNGTPVFYIRFGYEIGSVSVTWNAWHKINASAI